MIDANALSRTFTLEREPLELRFRMATLTRREHVTPGYVRVRVEGADLVGFGSRGHDDHIRIFLPAPGDAAPSTMPALRESPSREFTPLWWGDDGSSGWLDLEFAVHGDEGVAGVWAATAPLGSTLGVGGPRGSLRIEGAPDAWLLAGDETAIPQIRRYAALIADAPATILIEVADAANEVPIDAPAHALVEYVHRGEAAAGSVLAERLEAIGADAKPDGDVFGFIAAEQAIVKPGRALLVERWGLEPDRIVVKGYWKRGDAAYHAPH